MEPNPGQRFMSALVDLSFLLAISILGYHKILGEPVLASFFFAYAGNRFGVAMMKARSMSGPDSGNSGTSGRMQAVSAPIQSSPQQTQPREDRTRRAPPIDPRSLAEGEIQ